MQPLLALEVFAVFQTHLFGASLVRTIGAPHEDAAITAANGDQVRVVAQEAHRRYMRRVATIALHSAHMTKHSAHKKSVNKGVLHWGRGTRRGGGVEAY